MDAPPSPGRGSSRDGRWWAALIVAGYFALLGLGYLGSGASLTETWQAWGVPAMNPHFADLRNLAAGIENQKAGRAVGDPNPFDPFQRPYIYPSVWLQLGALGFDAHTAPGFALAIIALFLVSCWFVVGRLTAGQGVFTGFFVVSPAVMTGVERCNIDLLLLPLLLAALHFHRRVPVAAGLIALAAILKIHPLGALLGLVAPPWRKTLPWLGATGAGLAVYGLFDAHELAVIAARTPHYPFHSFGSATLALAQGALAHERIDYAAAWRTGNLLLAVVVVLAAWFRPRAPGEAAPDWKAFAFRMGAGLYLASFALGASNDYRLLFFLFCLPLLFAWRVETGAVRWCALSALVLALVFVYWDLLASEYALPAIWLKQGVTWTLAALLAALGATACGRSG